MIRAFEKMRHGMLGRAIVKNVVEEPLWHRRLNSTFIRWAMSQTVPVLAEIPDKLSYERAEQNPLTQRYWEHTAGLLTAPAGTDPWLVELARISVPDGSVAVLKSFEQVVIHDDLQSPTYFTASGNWGNPFVLPSTVTITWYFRLERSDRGVPALINVSSPTPLVNMPGEPHFDLPQIADVWFPAASPPGQNIHLTIGGRYRLRILALVERTEEYALSVSAKIRGFRLSQFDVLTQQAIRAIW